MAWVITIAAGAAAAWGASDFLAGALARRRPVLTVLIGSQIAAMLLALVVAALRGVPPPWDARLWLGVAAGVVGLPSMGLLYRAMRDGSPAVVAPIAAVAALVPVGWGLLHGDRLTVVAGLGIATGLVGVTMASWPVPGPVTARGATRSANLCGLGAALGLGVYFVLLHEAGAADEFWALASARIAEGLGALVLALALGRCDRTLLRAPIVAVGTTDALADAAYIAAAASALTPATVVASLYPAVTVLLNRSLLRERLHTLHWYGVIAALFSVACLAR
ncbi:EamA family transporter [Actinoplanes sp. KI2]|uniref:EamA family transporter n=1 Tax=Actinoplanes sp. KI2 TaxID=2983315 RepID=UPI0021D5AD71|nr:EamA family transporter [Actinoplanes sp. KI2]MCU7727735.1 EamA family transporter [Actinoplanes sp. KI2]